MQAKLDAISDPENARPRLRRSAPITTAQKKAIDRSGPKRSNGQTIRS